MTKGKKKAQAHTHKPLWIFMAERFDWNIRSNCIHIVHTKHIHFAVWIKFEMRTRALMIFSTAARIHTKTDTVNGVCLQWKWLICVLNRWQITQMKCIAIANQMNSFQWEWQQKSRRKFISIRIWFVAAFMNESDNAATNHNSKSRR